MSTLDLLGRGFVVLSPAEPWCAAARNVGLDAHRIEAPAFVDAYGTGAEGAVLVRPDGFIAWRARESRPDGDRELSSALDRVLSPLAAACSAGIRRTPRQAPGSARVGS